MRVSILRHHELPVREIHLVDIPAGKEKLEIVGALAQRMVQKAGLDINVVLTMDRRSAIEGADFVTTQFRVGLLDARIRDERIPLRYNTIGQETNGGGGFAKALRTIPVILDICKDIEELAPNARMVNFTNPSGMVTEAILKHSKVDVIGLCNVPIGIKMNIAKIFDVTAQTLKELANDANFTMKNIPAISWGEDLLQSLGVVPCPYHRYYYMTETMLEEEKRDAAPGGQGTRGAVVKKVEAELFELYKDPNLAIKPPQLMQRGGAYYSDAAC